MKYGNIEATAMINGQDIEVNVEYEYEEGERGLYAYANGDPGYPGTPDEVSILVITNEEGEDITDQIRSVDEERIIQLITDKEQD